MKDISTGLNSVHGGADTWQRRYNGEGPHSVLGNPSSREFAVLAEIADRPQNQRYGWCRKW